MGYLSAKELADIRRVQRNARIRFCASCQQEMPHIMPWAWPSLRRKTDHGRACLVCGWQHVNRPIKDKKLRRAVFEADNYECVYCSRTDRLGLDHFVPQSHGGPDTFDNLVTACHWCNVDKKDSRGHYIPQYGRYRQS
jgi:5-methylcytosine-specific restriction endonuclease McrA